jgi:nitronate monooxygenase
MNKLCEKLGIKYPIMQAGMAGGATTPELVSAVSDAGGLGILAASRLTPTQLKKAILKIKSKTQNSVLGTPNHIQKPCVIHSHVPGRN